MRNKLDLPSGWPKRYADSRGNIKARLHSFFVVGITDVKCFLTFFTYVTFFTFQLYFADAVI